MEQRILDVRAQEVIKRVLAFCRSKRSLFNIRSAITNDSFSRGVYSVPSSNATVERAGPKINESVSIESYSTQVRDTPSSDRPSEGNPLC